MANASDDCVHVKLVIAQGCQPPAKRFIETCDDEVHLSRKSQVVRTLRDLSCGPLMCSKNGLSSMLRNSLWSGQGI